METASSLYFDNSTVARPNESVVEAMQPFLIRRWGSPGAPHPFGQRTVEPLRRAYQSIYATIGADPEDGFVLTSSGAEAVNHVIHGVYFDVALQEGRNHFVTSWVDEAPAIMAIGRLERQNCVGKMAELGPDGSVTAKTISEALTPRTALVSLSWANGLTGVITPVEEIAEVCRKRGVLLHVDATHMIGKGALPFSECGADFVTFHGEPLHAPSGVGGLWMRKGSKLSSFIQGGMEQGGARAGTPNLPGLASLAKALELMVEGEESLAMEGSRLRDLFERLLQEELPEIKPLFVEAERLPTVTTLVFPGITSDALLQAIGEQGVSASLGGGSFQRIALLLQAMGCDKVTSHTGLSFSLSRETNEAAVRQAASIVGNAARLLRRTSEALL